MVSLIGDTKMEILSRLSESPAHGYQLHKEVGVTTSTIYAHLDEFEDAEMIEQVKPTEEGRVMYQITEQGEQLLELLE